MFWARVLADVTVVVHAAWVAFIVLGMAAILVGVVRGWSWVRNPWFRGVHLAMIGYVAFEALMGIPCPLTVWENRLRAQGGQQGYAADFIGYWAHRLIYVEAEPWVLTVLYVAFGLAVLATFALAPPRIPWRTGVSRPAAD